MRLYVFAIVAATLLTCSRVPTETSAASVAQSCAVTESEDGATITCPNGDTTFIPKGKDGKNGQDGADGQDGVGIDGKDGKDGEDGRDGKDGLNGKDGIDGKDAQPPEVVTLCGSKEEHAEVAMKVNGAWVAYFEDRGGKNRRLTVLVPGVRYVSTDGIQACSFTTDDLDKGTFQKIDVD